LPTEIVNGEAEIAQIKLGEGKAKGFMLYFFSLGAGGKENATFFFPA